MDMAWLFSIVYDIQATIYTKGVICVYKVSVVMDHMCLKVILALVSLKELISLIAK